MADLHQQELGMVDIENADTDLHVPVLEHMTLNTSVKSSAYLHT